jgi:hypothetical protein
MNEKVIMSMKVGSVLEERALESALVRLFESGGWKVSRSRSSRSEDFSVVKGGLRYAVEVKAAREGRRPLLEAFLADALLRAQATARAHHPPSRPLAVVAAPVLSESMAEALRDYVSAVAPGSAFGLVDSRGRFEFHGEGLEGLTSEPMRRPRQSRTPGTHVGDLFSDLNQFMLKALLGRYLPEELLHVPRGRIDGAAQLSKLAGTSLPSAWRFLSGLKDAGFLEESSGALEVVRRDDLLSAWVSAVRRPPHEVRAAFSIPVREPISVLEPRVRAFHSAGQRIAWGGFAAIARLGFQFVHGAPLHLYVEDLSEATLRRLNLVRAESNQASQVILRKSRWPESVFRAAVEKAGQPTTDILQSWLDVSQHPARGLEQANVLWTRVLAPALGIDGHRVAGRGG